MPYFLHIATFVHSLFKSRHQLRLENLALRQQLAMLKPSVKRPQVSPADRLFWILFSKYVDGWRTMLHALHPDTVVRWHREGFKHYWTWKSRRQRVGRPPVDKEIRSSVREPKGPLSRNQMLQLCDFIRIPKNGLNRCSRSLRHGMRYKEKRTNTLLPNHHHLILERLD